MGNVEAITDAYESLLVWVNSICLSLSILALLFIMYHWKSPVIILSQRGFLVSTVICLIISNAAYFAGSSTISECWVHYILYYVSMNAFFALLTAREYRVWQMHRAVKSTSCMKPINKWMPFVYVIFMAVVSLLIAIFAWLLPFSNYGVKPCQRDPSVYVPDQLKEVAQIYSYWFILNHVLAFGMAFVARNVPSVCGDAKTIFVLSSLGIIYVALSLASYNVATKEQKQILRICYTIFDLIIQVLAVALLVFKRQYYLDLDKTEVVKIFLNLEWDVYQAIAGGTVENADSTFVTTKHYSTWSPSQRDPQPEEGQDCSVEQVTVV